MRQSKESKTDMESDHFIRRSPPRLLFKRRYAILKRQIIILSTIMSFALDGLPAQPFTASSTAEGPIINNLVTDVFLFWDKARALSLEEKYKAWKETVESKHADFFESVIDVGLGLGGSPDDAGKRRMVEKFLSSLPEKIDHMRACAASMEKEIREIHQLLHNRFSGFPASPEYYLAISLGTSDGGVRPFKGRFICFFGVDVASEIRTEVRRRAWTGRRDHPAWTARPNAAHRALVDLERAGTLIGAAAGMYPSFFLSSFKPVSALSGKSTRGQKRSSLRHGLVVFQFSLSILLLVATMVVHKQMDFIQTRNLGYSQEQVVVVQTYGELAEKLPVLKDALRLHPSIVSVSASSSAPGTGFTNIGMGLEGANSSRGTNMYVVDADFLEVMKMEMAEGRFFDDKIPTDGQAVILNQSMSRELNSGDLLGKRMRIWSGRDGMVPCDIIGIVKDFHYESFHEPIKPLAMVMLNGVIPWTESYASIRVRTKDMPKTLSEIRKTWESVVPRTPFKFSFLDSIYDAQYQNEARTGRIFTIFTIFAIFVACIGLLGLASFAVEQRTKEIGIRKVMGASVHGLVLMLSGEFARWVTLANLIAWPLAYYLMTQWLMSFAYRTEIGPQPFLFSALLMLGITGLTVGYHAVKSALAEPVNSLRYE